MIFNFDLLGYPLVFIILYFSLYSFLGWCLETILATIKNKRITNRGFLYGPFCPMYGICSVLIIIIAKPIEKNVIILYLVCFLGASIIEYFTGFILEALFDSKWWDYSNKIFNLKGRICLLYSVIWGFVGVLLIKILQPIISGLMSNFIYSNISSSFSYILIFYFSLDLAITLFKLYELKSLFLQLEDISSEIKNTLINLKILAYDKVTLVGNLSKDKFNEAENFSREFWSKREVMDSIPKELKERYESIINRIVSGYSRIFIAFPQLNSTRLKKAFSDIRDKIKAKVR